MPRRNALRRLSACTRDALNRVTARRVNGAVTQGWIYKDGLAPVAETDAEGNVVSFFVYGTSALSPDYMVKDGTTYRFIRDFAGSVRLVVNADSGAVAQRLGYDAFGNIITDTNPGFQPFGFKSGLYDSDTGLVHFGARWYDPSTGRWISKDPILLAGGLNLYAFCGNDPVNFSDPWGLCEETGCPGYWDRYFEHLDEYLINVGPYASALLGGFWPKSLSPATGGRPPLLGSSNPFTSVPRALGIPGTRSAVIRAGAAGIGSATVAVGSYNIGVFVSGLVYVAFPGSNGL